MNEAEAEALFAALCEHLLEVRPIFDTFCARHEFTHVPKLSIGRYPRIRIAREGQTKLYFDLQMGLDENGRRYEKFSRDRLYELCAGASFVEDDGSAHGVRFQMGVMCFDGIPFEQVGAILLNEMEKHLPTIEGWDQQYLRQRGRRVKLGT